jgi:hypothetical protein
MQRALIEPPCNDRPVGSAGVPSFLFDVLEWMTLVVMFGFLMAMFGIDILIIRLVVSMLWGS